MMNAAIAIVIAIALSVVIVLLLLSSPLPKTTAASSSPGGDEQRRRRRRLVGSREVIGYYASWQWYDRDKLYHPSVIDYDKLTRINFAFFQPDSSGNIYGTDEWADPTVLYGEIDYGRGNPAGTGICEMDMEGVDGCVCHRVSATNRACNYRLSDTGLIENVHRAGREIYPSIGGWTLRYVLSWYLIKKTSSSSSSFCEKKKN